MQQAKNRGGSWRAFVQNLSAGVFHKLICGSVRCRFFNNFVELLDVKEEYKKCELQRLWPT